MVWVQGNTSYIFTLITRYTRINIMEMIEAYLITSFSIVPLYFRSICILPLVIHCTCSIKSLEWKIDRWYEQIGSIKLTPEGESNTCTSLFLICWTIVSFDLVSVNRWKNVMWSKYITVDLWYVLIQLERLLHTKNCKNSDQNGELTMIF